MINSETNYSAIVEELFEAVLALEDTGECSTFFNDLFTKQELISFAQRLQVAKRLLAGDTYAMIRSQIPVSSATITRISTALQFGSGGSRKVHDRLSQTGDAETSQ